MSQTSAALITTSLENLSAVCGSHSLAETVFLASLSLLRLICSEHMHTSFSLLFPFFLRKISFFRERIRALFCTLQIDNNNYIPCGCAVSRGFSKNLFKFGDFSGFVFGGLLTAGRIGLLFRFFAFA